MSAHFLCHRLWGARLLRRPPILPRAPTNGSGNGNGMHASPAERHRTVRCAVGAARASSAQRRVTTACPRQRQARCIMRPPARPPACTSWHMDRHACVRACMAPAAQMNNARGNASQALTILDKGIAFKSDIKYRFADIPAKFFNLALNSLRGGFNITAASGGPTLKQNERFINWMRVAALPRFRKLWGKIETDLKAGDVVTVVVVNRCACVRVLPRLGGRDPTSAYRQLQHMAQRGAARMSSRACRRAWHVAVGRQPGRRAAGGSRPWAPALQAAGWQARIAGTWPAGCPAALRGAVGLPAPALPQQHPFQSA